MILLYPIPYCYMVSFDVIRQSLSRSPSDKPEKYKYISQHTYSGGVLFLVNTNGIRRLQAIDLSLSLEPFSAILVDTRNLACNAALAVLKFLHRLLNLNCMKNFL